MPDKTEAKTAMTLVVERVLERMGADEATKKEVASSIGTIIDAIDNNDIESGTSCVKWKGGNESSVAAAVGDGIIQMLRLGQDNQIRGDIWLIKKEADRVVAMPLVSSAVEDHSSHDAMQQHAAATDLQLKNIKDALCMSQKLLGKAANYQEPTVPEHLQIGR